MSKPYIQKDLGYPRTPTSAMLRVRFGNGEVYDVPAQIVADDRDSYYRLRHPNISTGGTVEYIQSGGSKGCLMKWLKYDMDWSEVEPYAVKVDVPPAKIDYQEMLSEADIEVVGEV